MQETVRDDYFVRKTFRRFFVPALLSSLALAVGGLADCIFIGNKIGAIGLTAIGIGQPIYMFYSTISYALSIGGSIQYALHLSRGESAKGNEIFNRLLTFAGFLYLCISALGLVFLPQVLTLLGANPAEAEVYTVCESYVRAQLIFCPVMFCQGPFYYFVNSDSGAKTAAVALVTSNLIDIALNYVFVIRLNIGVAGSVYSTGIGAATMIVICLTHILKKRGNLRFIRTKFSMATVIGSARTGLATAMQYIFQFLIILIFNHLLMRTAGHEGVALFDVIFNVALLAAAISDGVSMALQPMVSTYLGENNLRSIRYTLKIAFCVTVVLCVLLCGLLLLFPEPVCTVFGLVGESIRRNSIQAIRIYACSILFAGINMMMTYYYQALGKVFVPYMIFTLRCFVLILGFGFLFLQWGITHFWWLYLAAEVGAMAVWVVYNLKKGSFTYLGDIAKGPVFEAFIDSRDADLARVDERVGAFLKGINAKGTQIYYVTMVVEEVCSTILESGFGEGQDGYIQLTLMQEEEGSFTLHLRDSATQFNPFSMDTESIDLQEGHGLNALGVMMIKQKAKDFFYRRYVGFNTLVIRL